MTPTDESKKLERSEENVSPTANSVSSVAAEGTPTAGIKLPRQVRSDVLLQGDRELQIIHGEEVYRLSVTRQGKLILHK